MTNEPKAGPGLDPELLAAYVDNRLPPDERAAVEATLAADPDSYAVLVDTLKAQDALAKVPEVRTVPEVPTGLVPRVPTRRWVIAASVLAAAAAVVLVVRLQPDLLQRFRGGDPVDPRLAKLVAAVGEERYIEARLTGGFKFGPLKPVTRGPGDLSQQNLSLLAAAGELQKTAQEDPTAENLHAWGVAQLLLLDSSAVGTLEEAARLSGGPQLQSDLAAAYLARATNDSRPEDLPRALASAERAIGGAPQLSEAWFNKALSLSLLGLEDLADESWEKYFTLESDPRWLAEGRLLKARVRRISDAARPDGTSIRERVEGPLLSAWADAMLTRVGESTRFLSEIQELSGRAAPVGADRYLSDLAHDLGTVQGSEVVSPARARQVQAFSRAMTLALEDRQIEATPLLVAAERDLCRWSDVLCASARLARIQGLSSSTDLNTTLAELEMLAPVLEQRSYFGLLGILRWRSGLAQLRRGDFEPAIQAYRTALELFTRAGETSNAANMHSLLAEAYRSLGDQRLAWREHLAAVHEMTPAGSRRVTHQILAQVSLSCLAMNLPECSLVVQTAAMKNAAKWGQASSTVMVHVQRARSLARMGRPEATVDLQAATHLLSQIPDPVFRARVEAEVLNAAGEVLAGPAPFDALASVERGIEAFDAIGAANRASLLRLTRGRFLAGQGRTVEARQDFLRGIAHSEQVRKLTSDRALRTSQFGPLSALFIELANLELLDGDDDAALQYVERSRASSFVDGANPVQQIARGLQSDTALIYYATDTSTPGAWIVTQQSTKRVRLEVERAPLERLVRRYRATVALGSDAPMLAADSRRLFELLVAPVLAVANPSRTWVIVPDATTAGIGLTALINPLTGKTLFMTHQVSIVASGSLLSNASARRRIGGDGVAVFLAYGSADPLSSLPALPNVDGEAKDSAAHYKNAAVFTGAEATGRRLREALRSADIVHVSAHAVARADYPGLSRLLLAPTTDHQSGYLFADEIREMQSNRTRVVVLAGCRTGYAGSAATAPGEGLLSLTTPFLVIGVPQVVASLWDVPDDRTRQFMAVFHRQLSIDGDAISALSNAQTQLSSGLSPGEITSLGAFQVFGFH